MTDVHDVTDFRFRHDNTHNRNMLEYRAETAFRFGATDVAARFAIAAGLYAIAGSLADFMSDYCRNPDKDV